jgi:hypothetical protein
MTFTALRLHSCVDIFPASFGACEILHKADYLTSLSLEND